MKKHRYGARAKAILLVAGLPLGGGVGNATVLAAPQVASYTVTKLPVPPGFSASLANGLNDLGQVALICTLDGGSGTRSFIWEQGQMRRVGEFGSGFLRQEASGINNSGQVSGSSWTSGFPAAAWQWEDGVFTDIGTLGGANAASFSINASGLQTGWSQLALPQTLWIWSAYLSRGGNMACLGEIPGAVLGTGHEVSDAGQVIVSSAGLMNNIGSRGALFDFEMGLHGLGTLGGFDSWAGDVNAAGQVVGNSATGRILADRWVAHAFLWQEGVMQDLGALPGHDCSSAVSINASGDIVGWSRPDPQSFLGGAVLWRGSDMLNLNDAIPLNSGWVLRSASAINASGQIIGRGEFNGHGHPFLLTPTP